MELQKLTYFISLAQTLSFTKAAKENHITQACMSRQISALEQEIGITLFNRNSRKVELSSEGHEFYWHAISIINNYNQAIEQITKMDKNKRMLRVGIGPYEHPLVQPVIHKYIKLYPDVRVSCLQYDYTTLANFFRNGTIDVMLCIDRCSDKVRTKEVINIYSGDWITLCSKDSPLAKLENAKNSDFTGQVFINMEAGANDTPANEAASIQFRPAYTLQTNTITTKLSLTASGVGISRVPKFYEEYLPHDVALIKGTFPSTRSFVCVYNDNNDKISNTSSAFIDIVREIYVK